MISGVTIRTGDISTGTSDTKLCQGMCIFSKDVFIVANTRIFVSPTKDDRQITVYQNEVGSESENAMILPIPKNTDLPIVLLDLTKDKEFFHRLNFETHPSRPNVKGNVVAKSKITTLNVVKVGSYDTSIAENIDDLDRINQDVFTISENILFALKEKYAIGFAFLVCKFDASKKENKHPIGYIHDLLGDKVLFVPTVHIHDGKLHYLEHFDHTIYALSTNVSRETWDNISVKRVLTQASFAEHITPGPLCRLDLKGNLVNEDLLFPLIATEPSVEVEEEVIEVKSKAKVKTKAASKKVAKAKKVSKSKVKKTK